VEEGKMAGKREHDSSSSSSSDSSSSSAEARASKRHKHHKRSKHKSDKDKKRSSSKKERKRDKRHGSKKHKKRADSDKAEREPRTGNLMSSWGKYGVIRDEQAEGSRYEPEFQAWLSDVKSIGAAALARWELDEHWKTFCEDFNTGTLPGKKYYDLRKWAAKQARDEPERVERTAFDDEEQIRRQRLEESRQREQQVSKDTLLRMGATNAIEDMRKQELAKMQMQHAWRTGDTQRAEEMLKKFQPETVEEKWARLKAEARALG
jgi:hypothetical protein